jgi:hypothetical protein
MSKSAGRMFSALNAVNHFSPLLAVMAGHCKRNNASSTLFRYFESRGKRSQPFVFPLSFFNLLIQAVQCPDSSD